MARRADWGKINRQSKLGKAPNPTPAQMRRNADAAGLQRNARARERYAVKKAAASAKAPAAAEIGRAARWADYEAELADAEGRHHERRQKYWSPIAAVLNWWDTPAAPSTGRPPASPDIETRSAPPAAPVDPEVAAVRRRAAEKERVERKMRMGGAHPATVDELNRQRRTPRKSWNAWD